MQITVQANAVMLGYKNRWLHCTQYKPCLPHIVLALGAGHQEQVASNYDPTSNSSPTMIQGGLLAISVFILAFAAQVYSTPMP